MNAKMMDPIECELMLTECVRNGNMIFHNRIDCRTYWFRYAIEMHFPAIAPMIRLMVLHPKLAFSPKIVVLVFAYRYPVWIFSFPLANNQFFVHFMQCYQNGIKYTYSCCQGTSNRK
jgi:hypothetical protein